MKRLAICMLLTLTVLVTPSCRSLTHTRAAITYYVVLQPHRAQAFIEDLAAIVRKRGLNPTFGSATYDRGNTVRVLVAKSWRVKLWAQNVHLSKFEKAADCSERSESGPDPGQFVVATYGWILGIFAQAAEQVGVEVLNDLRAGGYDVRTEQAECPASKDQQRT